MGTACKSEVAVKAENDMQTIEVQPKVPRRLLLIRDTSVQRKPLVAVDGGGVKLEVGANVKVEVPTNGSSRRRRVILRTRSDFIQM